MCNAICCRGRPRVVQTKEVLFWSFSQSHVMQRRRRQRAPQHGVSADHGLVFDDREGVSV